MRKSGNVQVLPNQNTLIEHMHVTENSGNTSVKMRKLRWLWPQTEEIILSKMRKSGNQEICYFIQSVKMRKSGNFLVWLWPQTQEIILSKMRKSGNQEFF